ncbi:MAG: hypothetical protein HYZ89_05600 [Candidatus Omnitrophica bacterium]|nr:hypothetical protein [Candidatus Omnitrophota bacterium]
MSHRQQIRVPISQIHKSVFKQAASNGNVRIHYLLTARLNGTVLRKLVRRKDWLELDVPQICTPLDQITPLLRSPVVISI